MKKKLMPLFICGLIASAVLTIRVLADETESATENTAAEDQTEEEPVEGASATLETKDGYTLEQVVVLSRHNMRAPLSGFGSVLSTVTPHTWFKWTAEPGELSLRGGILETEMGQYFRRLLEHEKLIEEDWIPETGQIRFYSNSMQRTIATARYFSAGMLPTANVEIEYHVEVGTMDPVFTPAITFYSQAYDAQVRAEIDAMAEGGLKGINESLSDNYELLADVIDFEDSEGYKSGEVAAFNSDDTVLNLVQNSEPTLSGTLNLGNQISDSLLLQYYETEDPVKAAFGHKLTEAQWLEIMKIHEMYDKVLFTAPSVCVNVAHPLLLELQNELENSSRIFTFLCGHDSNLSSVLAALGAAPYELEDSLDQLTPIGTKLVIEKLMGEDGQEYASLQLIYQSTDQLRGLTMLDVYDAPCSYILELEGLDANEDGYYRLDDVMGRLTSAINAYYELPEDT